MKAKGVRLHGANDLRLEEFELPEITDDEILVKVISDSICMSTYKRNCCTACSEYRGVCLPINVLFLVQSINVFMRMWQSIRQSWDMNLPVIS